MYSYNTKLYEYEMYEEYISYLLNIIVIRISYAVKGIGHLQIYIQSYHILYIYVGVSV